MGSGSVSRAVLYVANVFYGIAALAIAALGAWFFVQLNELMTLRNINHYYLNYRIYAVQVVPWLYMLTGVMLLMVACCGWWAAALKKKGLLLLYIISMVVIILMHVALAALVFSYVDGEDTDKFITDTILDAFHNAQTSEEAQSAFSNLEQKYFCCGAVEPRDYRKTRSDFPLSCCDPNSLLTKCDFTNSRANDRHGCSVVASIYGKMALKYLAAGSIVVGLMELVGLAVAIARYRKSKSAKEVIRESESKKVLL